MTKSPGASSRPPALLYARSSISQAESFRAVRSIGTVDSCLKMNRMSRPARKECQHPLGALFADAFKLAQFVAQLFRETYGDITPPGDFRSLRRGKLRSGDFLQRHGYNRDFARLRRNTSVRRGAAAKVGRCALLNRLQQRCKPPMRVHDTALGGFFVPSPRCSSRLCWAHVQVP